MLYFSTLEMDKYMKIDPRPPAYRHTSRQEVNNFLDNLKNIKDNTLDYPNGPMFIHTLNTNDVSQGTCLKIIE